MTDGDQPSGAEVDAAIERRIQLEHTKHRLRDIYAELDTLADSRDLPPTVVRELRGAQRAVSGVQSTVNTAYVDAKDREDRLRERAGDDESA